MELSMTIATVAAAAIGEFFTALGHHALRARGRGSGRHDGVTRTACDPRSHSLSAANDIRPATRPRARNSRRRSSSRRYGPRQPRWARASRRHAQTRMRSQTEPGIQSNRDGCRANCDMSGRPANKIDKEGDHEDRAASAHQPKDEPTDSTRPDGQDGWNTTSHAAIADGLAADCRGALRISSSRSSHLVSASRFSRSYA